MFFQVLILVALIRLPIVIEKAILCSGLYSAFVLTMSLLGKAPFSTALLELAAAFVFSRIYFLLFDRTSGTFWWVIVLT
jgi:hypothetical protein